MPPGAGRRGRLDLTPMYAMHDALRRETTRLAAVADPGWILATAAGWRLYKLALRLHHTAENGALWAPMRRTLTGRPRDLALLEAMEAEHAGIDELVQAIDTAVGDLHGTNLAGLVDALVVGVRGHLDHEEDRAVPLIQATLTAAQWRHFAQTHAGLVGAEAPRILPWLLDGADPHTVQAMLAPLPEPERLAFHQRWRPAYAATLTWDTPQQRQRSTP